jgi:hypothetical protein
VQLTEGLSLISGWNHRIRGFSKNETWLMRTCFRGYFFSHPLPTYIRREPRQPVAAEAKKEGETVAEEKKEEKKEEEKTSSDKELTSAIETLRTLGIIGK